MVKKALILAGGKGTRISSISNNIPKPMVQLAGKPVLEYQVEWCVKNGIEEIILIVNHLSNYITEYFKNGSDFGIKISYYHEETPLGTVGGVKALEDQIDSTFLVLYGDVVFDIALDRLLKFHKAKSSDGTLVIHPNDHPYDSDLVEVNSDDKITNVFPKPHNVLENYRNLVNAALYVFEPVVLNHLQKGVKADFGKEIFPKLFKELNLFGYCTPEYLKDMGTPDRWEHVSKDIESGKVARRNLNHKQKAIFLDRDGVLNLDTDLIHRPEDFQLYPYTAETLQKINKSDYLSIVVTNQSVIARNLTDLDGLANIHKKMETDLGQAHAYVDDIYFCPHHPDGGFPGENKAFKMDCDCRKPKPGMLLEAAEKYNIDLSQSFIIGDAERDIIAGHKAGVTTLAVRTGKGFEKASFQPDYFFANFEDAGNYILDDPFKEAAEEIVSQIDKKPFSIFIGGNARSGKSTLSKRLESQLEKVGKTFLKISLDHWILPAESRENEKGVLSNFQVEKLKSDLSDFYENKNIVAPGYAVHPSFKKTSIEYQYRGEDVIIVEGVIALAVEEWRELADLKVFKWLDEIERRKRFVNFYEWKGLNSQEIVALYESRKNLEYDFIDKDHIFADILIK